MDILPVSSQYTSPSAWREVVRSLGFFPAFVGIITLFAAASILLLPHPIVEGEDAASYVNAMQIYESGVHPTLDEFPPDPTPDIVAVHRMLTTSAGIHVVRILANAVDSVTVGWLVWDTVLFFGINILFYALLWRIFESHKVAFVGGLFLAGNYSMLTHGLGLVMDIGGWFFYVLAILLLYEYVKTGRSNMLLFAALTIAIGGFFKENAFLAYIVLLAVVLSEDWRAPLRFVWRMVPLTLLIAVPHAIHHALIYVEYGYTYLYWTQLAPPYYASRTLEYIKSLGSLLTFLAPLSAAGAVVFGQRIWAGSIERREAVFIGTVVLSSLPVLLWPGITQRVLFMLVPGSILLASVCVQRFQRFWPLFAALAVPYVWAALYMDSFLLTSVNLPF